MKINKNNMNTTENFNQKPYYNKKRKYNDYQNINIENIIRGRLNFQTTKQDLEHKFGLYEPSFAGLTSLSFLNNYKNWDEMKKRDFINLIGGIFWKQTRFFLDNLYKKYTRNNK